MRRGVARYGDWRLRLRGLPVPVNESLEEAADYFMEQSRQIREAYRQHNAGRDLSKQQPRRPDLRTWADAYEAAAHNLRRRAEKCQ